MIPNRWYPILETTRLGTRPRAITRFSQPLVLWRGPDRGPHLFPAHCPHRGADFGQGRVIEDTLQCPWHGFRFDAHGHCIEAPCEGACGKIPHGLRTEPIPVREAHGLVWAWQGEMRDHYPEIPFFDDVTLDLTHSSEASLELPYHYTRMVETNLDIHHTPFVHGNVIPGLGAAVADYHARIDGDRIYTSGRFAHRWSKQGMAFRADALLPNLGLIELSDKLRIVIAATPVDAHHSWVWFRYYQDYSNLPGIRRFISWIAVQSELRVVQKQDWRIFSRMTPGTVDDVDYHLVRADLGIALYLKRRRELLQAVRHG